MIDPRRVPVWVWVAAGAGVVLLLASRRPIAEAAQELPLLLADVAGGIFQGLAAVVGVPTTGQDKCCAAIAAYGQAGGLIDKTKAAFAVSARCPAGDYLTWAAGKGAPATCKATATAPTDRTGRGASGTW